MIELTPPDPDEIEDLSKITILADFNGTTYRLGAMLFDPEEVEMPQIMIGLSEYLAQVAQSIRFQTEAGQELRAMFSEIEGTE